MFCTREYFRFLQRLKQGSTPTHEEIQRIRERDALRRARESSAKEIEEIGVDWDKKPGSSARISKDDFFIESKRNQRF